MNLVKRIEVLVQLQQWLQNDDEEWKEIKRRATDHNKWFIEEFVNHRILNITTDFLAERKLESWVRHYSIDDNISTQKVGIAMAGNIPLVGFHDLLSTFVMGHHAHIKLSEKDDVLLKGIVDKMKEFDPEVERLITFSDMLKGCDAYIATGSNNTSRYFEYYFGKYPSIIRKNKTSVAILDGNETFDQLEKLADDVFLYFGLGCRNVTQLYVPRDFDFELLLSAFRRYSYLKDHDKFRNNYDYHLALLIMNNRPYMSNDCVVLVEGDSLFSPVSELYYSFYDDKKDVTDMLAHNESVQCVIGEGYIEPGQSQRTSLFDYADGIDTMQFLLSI